MNKFVWILLLVGVFFSDSVAQDTVYVQKRVIDTIFVMSPPDTVYIKKASAKSAEVAPEKNEFLTYYDTDTIPPAINFYIDGSVGANIILLALGVGVFGFELEQENMYRGSMIYNFSSLIQFHDIWKEWEGVKMVLGPGVGYRYYLGTIVVTHANPKKKPVKHRNVPLNSLSFYVQAMVGPTMTYISEKNIESDKPKNTSLDFGGFAKGTLGFVWNDGNFLWGMGLTGGYQYWSDKARLMLNMEKFSLINGSSQKGAFFGYEIKLGF